MCYNPKKYAHHGLGSEVRIYRKIGNDDSGQLCDAPMKKFCAFQQLGRSVLGRWSQRPPFRSKRYRSPRLRRRPRHTPEKSIQTSMRLEPRPGEKIWMVSSMQAAASPRSRTRKNRTLRPNDEAVSLPSMRISSSLENEITTTMSGYSTTYADKIITWTCKYIDKGSGKEMTATAYTRCVAVPCASAGSTVISASSHAGYESTWHDDTKIGVTGWIVGATSVDARKYTISSASSGTADNSIVGDGRGGYKNNYLESPSTVTTNGRDNISNLYNESYNGGSGFYMKIMKPQG